MQCKEIMKTDVECVGVREPAQAAARKMRSANIGFLPVCDAQGKVLGTVTDRDIVLRLVADGRPLDTPVADLMTGNVVACQPNESIWRAEELMSNNKVSRVMCVDEAGRLVGIISLSDIAQHEEDTERAARTLRSVSSREVTAQA